MKIEEVMESCIIIPESLTMCGRARDPVERTQFEVVRVSTEYWNCQIMGPPVKKALGVD